MLPRNAKSCGYLDTARYIPNLPLAELDQHPDHSTLAEFGKRRLAALAGLLTQGLQ